MAFVDLNGGTSAFARNFVEELRRCDELERKFRFFEEQIREDSPPDADLYFEPDRVNLEAGSEVDLDELDHDARALEAELQSSHARLVEMIRDRSALLESQIVLETAGSVMGSGAGGRGAGSDGMLGGDTADLGSFGDVRDGGDGESVSLLSANQAGGPGASRSGVTLFCVAGVIHTERVSTFQLLLWRATRGNVFLRIVPLDRKTVDPSTGNEVFKSVFIVFGQGERARVKIRRICESFGANVYPCPEAAQDRYALATRANERLNNLEGVIAQSKMHRAQVLASVSASLVAWRSRVRREAAIYHTLNCFDYDPARKCLVGQGWVPTDQLSVVQEALRRGTERSRALAPSILSVIDKKESAEKPPTHFVTNKVTGSFQGIIEAYGVARYGEVNPTTFSIVTFPFLFGVMFGDFGHGIMLTLCACVLIGLEKKVAARRRPLDEIVGMVFGGRYLLLFMGIFATYAGLLYNDCFSMGMDIFGSSWTKDYSPDANGTMVLQPTLIMKEGAPVYPFGLDPAWKGVTNELLFVNPLKMKLSVIMGVVQMTLGILLSAINATYFAKPYDFWLVFVPQIVFFLAIFGYMMIAIFVKWATVTTKWAVAPKIISILINMFLFPGRCCSAEGMDELFAGQATVQWLLFVCVVIAVPTMLLAKPCMMRRDHRRRLAGRSYTTVEETHDEEPFDFGDMMIHQMIHTIEFVLGAISNTASYLRLWALSLAHAELSLVFWERVIAPQFKTASVFGLFVTTSGWLAATIAVLLIMEALSAFLHALRLHWVELMNKHYAGDGVKFLPFSFRRALGPQTD